ncbi:MAG: hypothetical protein D6711_01870 [Chloroflexi bacterium]|nr:MAG: hypothetical protein D6711_01870 [Chloroflexota bacterium]
MNWTLIAELTAALMVIMAVAGYMARRLYRHDSNRIAQHLNLKIGFFGQLRGIYNGIEITIEPRNPIKIMVRYKPTQVDPAVMDVNMWLLRKGLPLPADATTSQTPNQRPQHVEELDTIFDHAFDVWSQPTDFAQRVFTHQQKLGSRLAKSNLQQIELNWLFPGLSCYTDLGIRNVDLKTLQRNVDLVVELAELLRTQVNDYLAQRQHVLHPVA